MKRIPLMGFAIASVFAAGSFATVSTASAQNIKDMKKARSPLVLDAQGSFFVGGDRVKQTLTELIVPQPKEGEGGHLTLNQMYVRYMIPAGPKRPVPVVMLHGGSLTGKGYETQPDGRMGWMEYFTRKHFSVYVPDQVGAGRSGFDTAPFNDARAGVIPASSLPPMPRLYDESLWNTFRFGPEYGNGYRNSKFPLKYMDEYAKQVAPDGTSEIAADAEHPDASPDLNFKAVAELGQALNGAVIISHSQSSLFGLEAMLINPKAVKGLIIMEAGLSCAHTASAPFNDQQIAKFAKVPMVVVFSDHLDQAPTKVVNWMAAFNECKAFVARVKKAGGDAQMLHLPEIGIYGNTHMLMNDTNSDQIADLLINWIDKHVKDKPGNGNGNGNGHGHGGGWDHHQAWNH